MKPEQVLAVLVGAWTLIASPASAHAPLHESIAAQSRDIARTPGDAGVYIRRAELHREHRDFAAALRDLAKVERLRADHPDLHLARARVQLDAGQAAAAVRSLDRHLSLRPQHAAAWFEAARAQSLLGRHRVAAEAFAHGLEWVDKPSPDQVLTLARAWRAAGGKRDTEQALRALDEGIAKLGPIAALQTEAVAIESELGRHDAALARLMHLARDAARRETWMARRGDVLRVAGRHAEAADAYREALTTVAALPDHLKQTPQTQQLVATVERQLFDTMAVNGEPR
jgi:tetratricopeptide (TPR) repeat protein